MSKKLSSIFSCGRAEKDDDTDAPTMRTMTLKVVVVGDGAVGKTSLLTRFVTNEFDERYEPTIFENQAAPVTIKNKKVLLNLFDTAGQESYEHLRPFMYPDTDVVLICFSVDSRGSLTNVRQKWIGEVRNHLPKVPVLLLGLKSDLRGSTPLGTTPSSTAGCRLRSNISSSSGSDVFASPSLSPSSPSPNSPFSTSPPKLSFPTSDPLQRQSSNTLQVPGSTCSHGHQDHSVATCETGNSEAAQNSCGGGGGGECCGDAGGNGSGCNIVTNNDTNITTNNISANNNSSTSGNDGSSSSRPVSNHVSEEQKKNDSTEILNTITDTIAKIRTSSRNSTNNNNNNNRTSSSSPTTTEHSSVHSKLPETDQSNSALQNQVTFTDGHKMSEEIGARAYFECSAKTNQGVTVIFQEAGRSALKYKRRSSILSVFGPKTPRTSSSRNSKSRSGAFFGSEK